MSDSTNLKPGDVFLPARQGRGAPRVAVVGMVADGSVLSYPIDPENKNPFAIGGSGLGTDRQGVEDFVASHTLLEQTDPRVSKAQRLAIYALSRVLNESSAMRL